MCSRSLAKGGVRQFKIIDRLRLLFADYNSAGITSIVDRNASLETARTYQKLFDQGELTLRIAMSRSVSNRGTLLAQGLT
ncbi:MAG: hypothetical protein M2R45_01036 [Verrucomicrobia subdivision 3 bacterium]|nr:hypothetical protein [Limisphaerales bacterium]MCS1414148.1 hypothetical protein [Limisphaerales bacterium]